VYLSKIFSVEDVEISKALELLLPISLSLPLYCCRPDMHCEDVFRFCVLPPMLFSPAVLEVQPGH